MTPGFHHQDDHRTPTSCNALTSEGRISVPGISPGERLRAGFQLLESQDSPPPDLIRETCRLAERVLGDLKYTSVSNIRRVFPREFVESIPYESRGEASLALETIGWYVHRHSPRHRDVALQFLERAAALCPLEVRAVERFSLLALEVRPEDLHGLQGKPKKQAETVTGYQRRAKDAVEGALKRMYGVDEGVIFGRRPITSVIDSEATPLVMSLLDYYSTLTLHNGAFFGKEALFNLSLGARCCQLELLGYSRNIEEVLAIVEARIADPSESRSDLRLVAEVLDGVSTINYSRAHLWCENEYRAKLSERIDELLDLIDPRADSA